MSKGFYLYCVRPRTEFVLLWGKKTGFSPVKVEKTIGGGEVSIIPYEELEAVTSLVDLNEFGSEEIQRKAQEDLIWIKEKTQIHEYVIEQAMRLGSNLISVIPMKFGTIFKTKEKLEETLKTHYNQFKEGIERLKGKQEWAVKVYLNRKTFKKEIKKVSPVVQEKEKEIASMPEGVAYFMQKQIDEAVSREADRALENYTESFFENLKKYAATGTKGKILEKELTGKSLPMALNMIFLISEERLEDFIKEIDKLSQEYKSKGFNFEYSGPWPPYNFI